MRFPLAVLFRALDARVHFDFRPGVFSGCDAEGLARGVFDAGGGDGDGGDLVGEGVGPECWGWGFFFFFFFGLSGFIGGRRRGGGFFAEEVEEVFSSVARSDGDQSCAFSGARARGEGVCGEGEGGPFVLCVG